MTTAITPFRIAIPQRALDDLAQRQALTRWPEPEVVGDWSQGVPAAWLERVFDYWRDDYDWRAREAALNRFDHFTTSIDGLDVHFIHQRSPHGGARPLLITHGWPGSIVEFHKVIEPLVDPVAHGGEAADAFHVVCPSLPGYGFSGKPATPGWGVERIARAWAALMARLGYANYLAQGGDWGSAVTQVLGWQDAAHCAGIHVTLAMSTRPAIEGEPTPQEQRALDGLAYYRQWDAGYSKQQATRPQTIGYALTDSPLGQAAWILEKFWAWTDCDGDPLNVLSMDELLDNLMLYWLTASAASSARLYWQSFGRVERKPIEVPTGVAVYPKEIVPPVRSWMEAGDYRNIVHWAEMPRGGHFAAFEQPAAYVDDVRAWARKLR
ncbi:MAG: epoxide hydrolase [Gammaproteobacteria bacterium]|nr:epoxide hydrolase [Gammaproteobacteria bacterium]MCP5201874.1 epoxide hydrolase [Gammaproteobacteria bacterium]